MDAEGWGCGDAAGWGRRDVVGWRRGDAAGHEHGVTVVNFTHGKGAGLGRGHQSTVPIPHPCRQKELLHPDMCWDAASYCRKYTWPIPAGCLLPFLLLFSLLSRTQWILGSNRHPVLHLSTHSPGQQQPCATVQCWSSFLLLSHP